MSKQTLTVGGLALILGLGAGYFGSHALAAPSKANAAFTRGGAAGGFARTAQNQAGFVSGTVASVSSTAITVDTRDGSSHVVVLAPTTTVSKSVSGSIADITTGANVIVSGTPNSDGSVLATLIQLRPATTSPMIGQ